MKNFILFLLLVSSVSTIKGQNTIVGTDQPEYIKYDPTTEKTDKTIPFDRRFKLEISPISFGEENDLLVFEMGFDKGLRYYKADSGGLRMRASFIITKEEITFEKNKIIIPFPALKPEKDFRIQLRLAFSGNTLHSLLFINKLINDNYSACSTGLATDATILPYYENLTKTMSKGVKGDRDTVSLLYSTIEEFRNSYYLPVKKEYQSLLDSTNKSGLLFPSFLDQNAITTISQKLTSKDLLKARIHALQKILDDNKFPQIVNGQLSINHKRPLKLTNIYKFDSRITNLNGTIAYFDSLIVDLNTLKARDPGLFSKINTKILDLHDSLLTNKATITKQTTAIRKVVAANAPVNIVNLFGGSTASADLQTAGKRHITLEAGYVNIVAYNNESKSKNLGKPFIGITYHPRSIDKSVNLKKIPPPIKDKIYSHSLESQYNFWTRFGITAGVTLGSISNRDFDNIYNTFSFTLGPSVQVLDGFRVSAGAATVKRVNNNPLQSDKSAILGWYWSVSLDYDLIEVAKNVTSMIFK